jgi:hypothetical protein
MVMERVKREGMDALAERRMQQLLQREEGEEIMSREPMEEWERHMPVARILPKLITRLDTLRGRVKGADPEARGEELAGSKLLPLSSTRAMVRAARRGELEIMAPQLREEGMMIISVLGSREMGIDVAQRRHGGALLPHSNTKALSKELAEGSGKLLRGRMG